VSQPTPTPQELRSLIAQEFPQLPEAAAREAALRRFETLQAPGRPDTAPGTTDRDAPFQPGELIEWCRGRYLVVANHGDGTGTVRLVNRDGQLDSATIYPFQWSGGGEVCTRSFRLPGTTNADAPFSREEIIHFAGQDYEVRSNYGPSGYVREYPGGNCEFEFHWVLEGEACTRVVEAVQG
jgi:hypothetical protein